MKTKKKYIIITPYFPSESSFMGSYIYDQAKAIMDTKLYNVQIIKVVSIFSNEKPYDYHEFKVQIFKVIDLPFFIFPGLFHFLNKYRVKHFFQRNKLDEDLGFIHSHVCYPAAYLANAVACGKKTKTIAQHHGLDVFQLYNGRVSFLKKIQKKILVKRSIKVLNKIDLNVSVSQKVQSELYRFKGYNPIREYILYNGVDTSKFYKQNTKENDVYTIGCVANFWPIKDHISLLKAINFLFHDGIKISLKFVGSGETVSLCKKYITENNLQDNVEFISELKHEDLNVFYNEIDLFVLPSFYEALGCVYLEAWATDTPFIAIKNQGIGELLTESEKDCLLADETSPLSLKEKILAEYHKKRLLPFDKRYDIKSTISIFLKDSFFINV